MNSTGPRCIYCAGVGVTAEDNQDDGEALEEGSERHRGDPGPGRRLSLARPLLELQGMSQLTLVSHKYIFLF